MKIEIIGVYPVMIAEPCHLIEMKILDHSGPVDIGAFTQEIPGQPKDNWQVPWDERVLDGLGERDLHGRFPREIVGRGELRVVFFFHYLNLDQPMQTPAGEIDLPGPTERPERLRFMTYESPC